MGYLERKYRHTVLGCCAKCMKIHVYKVTDEIMNSRHWGNVTKCDDCEGPCGICILSKRQKPPGFTRKCGKCAFRFVCATSRIKEVSPTLVSMEHFAIDERRREWTEAALNMRIESENILSQ